MPAPRREPLPSIVNEWMLKPTGMSCQPNRDESPGVICKAGLGAAQRPVGPLLGWPDPAVDQDRLIRDVGVAHDRRDEVGDLAGLTEPAHGDPSGEFAA